MKIIHRPVGAASRAVRNILFIASCLGGLLASPVAAGAAEKVVLQLIWDHQFQFAGYYAAKWQGFYAAAGLDVEIRPGVRPGRRFVRGMDELKAGRADFTIAGANLLVERDHGARISALAVIFQESPVAFYYRAELGRVTPADLVNLRVARLIGGITDVEFQSMLRAEGIDPALIKPLRQEPGLSHLADRRVDVVPGYSLATPWIAEQMGIPVRALRPQDHGVDFYGDTLVAHQRIIDRDPQLVRRFVEASLKGWDYALDHTDEIARRISDELPRTVPVDDVLAFNLFQAREIKKLMLYPHVDTGNVNAHHWRLMHEYLKRAGLVKGTFDPETTIVDFAKLDRARFERIVWLVLAVLGGCIVAGVVGWFVVLRKNLSAVKRVEADLRKTEERYALAITATNDGVWDRNLSTNEIYRSPRWFQILGYEQSDLGPDEKAFYDLLAPEDAERCLNAVRAHLETRAPFAVECRVRRKSGEYIWISINAQAEWDEDGKPVRLAGSIRDISERKLAEEALRISEERFHSIFEGGASGNIVINESGVVEGVNSAALRIFGYRIEDLSGKNIAMLMPNPDSDQRDGSMDWYVKTGEEHVIGGDREVMGLRENGEIFPIHLATGELYLGDHRSFIVSVTDLTNYKALEDQLRQAQKMEAVGQLTGGIAHDFNNLLTVVTGNLEMAQDRLAKGGDVASLLALARDGATRGAMLTHRLLAFSRKQALEPRIIDARRLALGMTDLLRRTLEESVEIDFMGGEDLWRCEADPGQLENVILNLAINARDAMAGSGKLTIETGNVELDDDYAAAQAEMTPGHYVMIAVTDTGVGMPQDMIDRAFDPFFTTKEVGRGSGLGLSMVHGFAKQSRGHVTIYSEEGVGTTVKLYLPRSHAAADEPRLADPTVAPIAGGERILVVEDDPDVLKLSVTLLRDLGYEILDAANAEGALKVLESSSRVELLFTDVVLTGGMSGPELAAEVRRRRPEIGILYTSGYTVNAIVHQGRLDDGIDLLNKPFKKADLARKIRAALDKSKA